MLMNKFEVFLSNIAIIAKDVVDKFNVVEYNKFMHPDIEKSKNNL